MVALTILLTLVIQIDSPYYISFRDVIVALTAVIIFLFAVLLLIGIYDTARQIERFDAYKLEFETRWGSVDSSE
jgi:membrane protein YdbS with pleckstrin-like domain